MRTAFGPCLAAFLAASPALADGIDDMCLGGGYAVEDCACAREVINHAFPDESVRSYEATARHYKQSATPEKPDGDWGASLAVAAKETSRPLDQVAMQSGEVGRAHQTAMYLCRAKAIKAEAAAETATPEGGAAAEAGTPAAPTPATQPAPPAAAEPAAPTPAQ